MALTATVHRFEIGLSDVDRGVYETLDLRVAQHPSETPRFLLTRVLAYALSYEEGIAFSKGGISSTEEPPISVRDPTGTLRVWIDVGAPTAERLHKASKAAQRVALFTSTDLRQLRKEAASRPIHKVEAIDVWPLDTALLDAIEAKLGRTTKMDLTRNDGHLYITIDATTIEGPLERVSLV